MTTKKPKRKTERGGCGKGGGKKRTVRKSKKKESDVYRPSPSADELVRLAKKYNVAYYNKSQEQIAGYLSIRWRYMSKKEKSMITPLISDPTWLKQRLHVKPIKMPKSVRDVEYPMIRQRGGRIETKKWTVKKSKMKRNANSAYFEFRSGSSRKFWRITKNGSKITTHYGKIGTLGQMTTKDYGSKVDKKFDSLLKSKKDKGYVEKEYYGHVSESNPKPPTKVEREYLRICKKAEKSKVLNPNAISQDCEAMLDQGESELKWFTGWHKDALKKGEYDWTSYEEHSKSKRKKK